MVIVINAVLTITFGILRILGVILPEFAFTTHNPLFKDFAHLYVGCLFGMWRTSQEENYRTFYRDMFWIISGIELFCFILGLAIK